MEIITLAEYKVFASISSPNQDAQLTPLVNFVNEFVSDYLGVSESVVEYLDNSNTLLLPSSQLVASIVGDIYTNGILVPNSIITDFMQLGFKVVFATPITGKVIITLSNSVGNPAIKEACFLLVKYYLKEEYKPNIQSGQEQVQASEPKGLPIYIKNILDLYRES
jgi:hypothetical protein